MKNNSVDFDRFIKFDRLIDRFPQIDKIYMDEDLIEDKLYQIIDQFYEIKITPRSFIQYF